MSIINRKVIYIRFLSGFLCSEGGSKPYLELLETAHLSNPFAGNTAEDICRPIVDELYGLL